MSNKLNNKCIDIIRTSQKTIIIQVIFVILHVNYISRKVWREFKTKYLRDKKVEFRMFEEV